MPWKYEQRPRLYRLWHNVRSRCRNPKFPRYSDYGGRGIQLEFTNYDDFKVWALSAGYGDDLTIERRDNNGPYSRDNCYWIPRAAQARNRRNNSRIEIFGETKTEIEWTEDQRCTVDRNTFAMRLYRGWNAQSALTEPVQTTWNRHVKHD